MKTSSILTIFVTPLKGEEIRVEKACAHIEATPAGRRVAFSDEQPAETYAVCWGNEYKEEDGENNATATTTDESEAKEIALNESRANGCTMSVVRMSDKAVIFLLSDEVKLTTETATDYNAMLSPTEAPASLSWGSEIKTDEELTALGVEAFGGNETAPELSPAGYCLDVYLNNTSEIYERYTVKAIEAVANAKRVDEAAPARLDDATAWSNLTFWISWQKVTKNAVKAAARMVEKHDHMTPTAKDIEQVTRNYAAYIVDCAEYEIENA